MVEALKDVMRSSVDELGPGRLDLGYVVSQGRRRTRRRRTYVAVGAAAAVAAVAAPLAVVAGDFGSEGTDPAGTEDVVGPVLRLDDAVRAQEGRDYDVLASQVNDDLELRNGTSFDGVTDDGIIVVKSGPFGVSNSVGMSLFDPATQETTDLPDPPDYPDIALELSAERLVYVSMSGTVEDSDAMTVDLLVLDRATLQWRVMTWPGLPTYSLNDMPPSVALGPDDRAYVTFPRPFTAEQQAAQESARAAAQPGDDVDDAGIPGSANDLWSASMSDLGDVRDESMDVGAVAFSGDSMAWSATDNGTNDRVFVRDLATGETTSFDPRSGARCNLLTFGLAGDKVVMGQYCGDTASGRDDRVQILTTDGEPVVTLQGDGIDGYAVNDRFVRVDAYPPGEAGPFAYDLDTGRLLRLGDEHSVYTLGQGPVPEDRLLWSVGINGSKGAEQFVARVR